MYLSIKAMYNTWPDGRLDFISKYAYLVIVLMRLESHNLKNLI